MIKIEEVREHLGMWSRQARPLMRQYIAQQEKIMELLDEFFKAKREGKNLVKTYEMLNNIEREIKGWK